MMQTCCYWLAAQWLGSCLQWAHQCSAGLCWVVGLRQYFCCHIVRRAIPHRTHPVQVVVVALILIGLVGILWQMSYRVGHVKAPVILPSDMLGVVCKPKTVNLKPLALQFLNANPSMTLCIVLVMCPLQPIVFDWRQNNSSRAFACLIRQNKHYLNCLLTILN